MGRKKAKSSSTLDPTTSGHVEEVGSAEGTVTTYQTDRITALEDKFEMSFVTSKRAHSIVLQEIEKGNCDWDNIDKIEKPRCCHTQRNMAGSTKANSDSSDKVFNCKLFNKGMCRHEKVSEHTEKGILYQHYCSCFLPLLGNDLIIQKLNV